MQKQRFSRREFLLLAGATGGAALLAACQPVPPAASGSGEGTAVEPVTVAVQSGWCTGGDCDIWTPSIELFNEKYPHITIDMIRIGVNPEDTMTAVAGGTAPDIYHRYIGGFSELMARGVMLPLDDLIAGATDFDSDIYIGTQWHNGKWDFITYGIPVLEGGAMPAICWHKPHIAEFGGDPEVGPSSWMEMLEWPGCSTSTTLPTTRPKRVMIPQDAYGFKVIAWPVLFDENYITEDKMTFTFDSEGRTERLETIAQFWFDAGVDEIQAFAQE